MKQVVITGGTGFVGANLARRLLRDGHDVHLLVRRNYSPWRIVDIQPDLQLHQVDLDDPESLTHILTQIRPDWVFHLAAHGAYSWQTDIQQIVRTNINGTVNLVLTCLATGFEAFVNTGSSSEYGFKDHPPAETERLEPNSYYAVTKAAATHFCSYTARSHDVRIPTLRPYNVYGPYEEPNRFIPALIIEGLKGKLPPLVRPSVARDFVYVDDICDAYVLAASKPGIEQGGVYNLGTGTQTSIGDAVELARHVMDIYAEPEWESMSNRNWDTNVWISDSRKARDQLGWQPRHTFEQGFRRTVNWFRDNPGIQSLYTELRGGYV